jgi:hypothetical protein
MTAVIVVGMWQVVGQTGNMFQPHRGKVRGRAMDRRPEETAVVKVAQLEGGTETALTSAKVTTASALHHCQPMNGCTWSATCASSRRRARKPCFSR